MPRLRLTHYVLLIACILFLVAAMDGALAQPFGMTRGAHRPKSADLPAGFWPSRPNSTARSPVSIRAAKADGSAAYTLLGISFSTEYFTPPGRATERR